MACGATVRARCRENPPGPPFLALILCVALLSSQPGFSANPSALSLRRRFRRRGWMADAAPGCRGGCNRIPGRSAGAIPRIRFRVSLVISPVARFAPAYRRSDRTASCAAETTRIPVEATNGVRLWTYQET